MNIQAHEGIALKVQPQPASHLGRPRLPAHAQGQERHLTTDHLRADLKHRTLSSGFVTVGSQGIKFVLTLGSTMVLARLLTPDDFGLIAMVTTVTGFLRVFKDAGLSTATIQRETITHAQVSNLFWINLGVSAAMGMAVAGLAPLIARFYNEPKLTAVTVAMSVTFLLGGSTVQHAAILTRQMRFRAIAVVEISALALSAAVGVIMALLGYGYWSLVGVSVTQELAGLALIWSLSKWRPQLPARNCGTRPLLRFGAGLTAANLVGCVTQNMDTLMLGRIYGAGPVGLYSRAMALLMRPVSQFLGPITSVFEPALARLQQEPQRYRNTFLQVYNAIALTSLLGSGLLLALAKPVTALLLGEKWEGVSIIFAGFTVATLFVPVANTTSWLLVTQGRGSESVKVSVGCAVIALVGISIGLPFGAVGVAWGWSISGLLGGLPYVFHMIGRQGPVGTRDLWCGFLDHLPVWLFVVSVTYGVHLLIKDAAPALQLLLAVPVGLAIGAITISISKKSRETARQSLQVCVQFFGRCREVPSA